MRNSRQNKVAISCPHSETVIDIYFSEAGLKPVHVHGIVDIEPLLDDPKLKAVVLDTHPGWEHFIPQIRDRARLIIMAVMPELLKRPNYRGLETVDVEHPGWIREKLVPLLKQEAK